MKDYAEVHAIGLAVSIFVRGVFNRPFSVPVALCFVLTSIAVVYLSKDHSDERSPSSKDHIYQVPSAISCHLLYLY